MQSKLTELIPIAEQALKLKGVPNVQMTALALFRKIIVENQELGLRYLDSFIPYLLDSMQDSTLELKIESLHTLSLIATYPNQHITKYVNVVTKKLTELLDDKKRVVRKFARNGINDW